MLPNKTKLLSIPVYFAVLLVCFLPFAFCCVPVFEKNTEVNQTRGNEASAPFVGTSTLSIDEILAIAKKHSPDCRIKVDTQMLKGCPCSATDIFEESDPTFEAKYVGEGVWIVNKKCSVNPSVFNVNWYFYESTKELVIRNN